MFNQLLHSMFCRCGSTEDTTGSLPFGYMLTPEQDLWTTNQFSLEFWFSQEIARSMLLVPACVDADLVFVPLKLIWAACNDDVRETVSIFMAHMKIFLPLLDHKPHIVTLSPVADWNGIDMQQLLDAGVTV